ncbi:MAG: 50S ribosomal protein L6 [Thermoplasmata archaeon]|nr:50S ribosomal protein L6 [Thermoplasmata archaeon]
MSTDLKDRVTLPMPSAVTLKAGQGRISVKGPKGTVERPFPSDALDVRIEKGTVTLTLKIPPERKQSKALLHTWEAHVRNLMNGVTAGFEAKMKIVAAHFPMKVAVKDDQLVIENFLGEKFPRTASLRQGVEAKVDGEFVVLTGNDVELVGQSSANIERATHIRDYDPRVFQDGIYIVERAHPKVVG